MQDNTAPLIPYICFSLCSKSLGFIVTKAANRSSSRGMTFVRLSVITRRSLWIFAIVVSQLCDFL